MNFTTTSKITKLNFLILAAICTFAPKTLFAQQTAQTLTPQQKLTTMEAAISIGGAYRTWSRAFDRKDISVLVDWMDRNCTADCSVKMADSKVEKKQAVQAWIKEAVPTLHLDETAKLKIKQFRIDGDITEVTVACGSVEVLCQPAVSKSPKQLVAKDTWVKTSEGWKLKSRQIVADIATDTKPAASAPPTPKH